MVKEGGKGWWVRKKGKNGRQERKVKKRHIRMAQFFEKSLDHFHVENVVFHKQDVTRTGLAAAVR